MQNDLRNQLKGQTLDAVAPAAFKQVGGVVYPDQTAARNLDDFVSIVKSYQAVHLPTYGTIPIPRSTVTIVGSLLSTKTSADLLTADNDEVLEIYGISVRTPSNYETSGGGLYINGRPVIDLTRLDQYSNSATGLLYGIQVGTSSTEHATRALILNGGDTLSIETTAQPNDDIVFDIIYAKLMQ